MAGNSENRQCKKSGMTLIEMAISMGVVVVMSAGLYTMGITVRRSSERLRIETEARSYAKEAVEEIIGSGQANLAMEDYAYAKPANLLLPRGALLTRFVSVIWHDKTGAVSPVMDAAGYAEVHVSVRYLSPTGKATITDTISTIVN